jgi:NAD(P)-dependent dehydrogenase (short-subunit alcohol dehydrogenase family)
LRPKNKPIYFQNFQDSTIGEITMSKWTVQDMPEQTGRVAIVTGANSGLGYETSLALASKGAEVLMACRNMQKGQEALNEIRSHYPQAKLVLMKLDLGSLESLRQFANDFHNSYNRLDLLINNAGLMAIPRAETVDGLEMQFAVNHLGHFALTGLLLDMLLDTKGSRVVNVSSTANLIGRIHFDDINLEKNYSRYGAYGQSKLANVMFTFELQGRLEQAGADTVSIVAHPGLSHTNLQTNTANATGNILERITYSIMMPLFSQSQAMGALPQLYAATAPEAKAAAFYGPDFLHTRGYPTAIRANRLAYKEVDQRRLWEISEELTGVTYNFKREALAV